MAAAAAMSIPPVLSLKGVGPTLAARLQKLGVFDLRDLLLHAPIRYEDRRTVVPIAAAAGKCLIEGEVVLTEVTGRRRPMLVSRIRDGSGAMDLRFFHFSAALRNRLLPGSRWRCFGEVRVSGFGREMIHPELEPAQQASGGIVPVYATTPGLSQRTLRRLQGQALDQLVAAPPWLPALPPESLPPPLRMALVEALAALHRPGVEADPAALTAGHHPAWQRLTFEELLAHQLAFRNQDRFRAEGRAPALPLVEQDLERFLAQLPFRLTDAQRRAFAEIRGDLAATRPMGRLLQGDVGSGKTVVAALAALCAAANGWQTALMAPTELLAEQHAHTWRTWFAPLGVRLALLTARTASRERRRLLEAVAGGEIDVVVGTHALFQRAVDFARLGLVIVDEQHRFGVDQRLALKAKADGWIPHYLVMTATPIPRTLAMLRYGDLEVSVIDKLPPGRQPVETRVMSEARRTELIARLQDWLAGGRQAYWVCTLIEESEVLAGEAAEKTAERLAGELPGVRIGLVHGRMKGADKEAVMAAFKAGDIDLLVATTVIEVGVDVPNAGLMVIENAERLGLAQLHQLRGRVGRGPGQSYCILLYRPPLTEAARQRLDYLRRCHDGFTLAEKDLELRGPGEVLGTRQSGALQFKMADPVRDRQWLPQVRQAAEWLERHAPERIPPLLAFWIGSGDRYADV
ncbi:ATP-dependent DNA helicase RecG [Methylomarinovum tepidoasis]|uniref:ATP-dependent DNA helicase RecG n=1 Tax=Methylomarinovum tepidoasis TaxID=2840183 RepID=A0AAU9CBJ7_9GAMM|nr:ATP-dependent DNA helicase RecG [Methylomarinovum sp. IN45]BCX89312.1 ATP-dependent DNA helicase RecG [Methylomarinovum sp. IN45]